MNNRLEATMVDAGMLNDGTQPAARYGHSVRARPRASLAVALAGVLVLGLAPGGAAEATDPQQSAKVICLTGDPLPGAFACSQGALETTAPVCGTDVGGYFCRFKATLTLTVTPPQTCGRASSTHTASAGALCTTVAPIRESSPQVIHKVYVPADGLTVVVTGTACAWLNVPNPPPERCADWAHPVPLPGPIHGSGDLGEIVSAAEWAAQYAITTAEGAESPVEVNP